MFDRVPLLPARWAVRPVTVSLLLHLMVVPLLPLLLRVMPRPVVDDSPVRIQPDSVVYYHFTKMHKLPNVRPLQPAGRVGRPSSGTEADRIPPVGASKSLGRLFAVSHPRTPDNDHQTILQSKSPAELRIKTDVTLPNLLAAGSPTPKRPLEFHANDVRPVAPTTRSVPADAQALTKVVATPANNGMLTVSVAQPHLPVPTGGASAPVHAVSARYEAGEVPDISAQGGDGDRTGSLFALGLDPSGSTQDAPVPPGNRYGEFAVAPGTTGRGSPAGVSGGHMGGGVGGGKGAGGGSSTGMGEGGYGGGGGETGPNGFVSLRGSGSESAALGDPGPAISQLVYAIPASMLIRHNRLVVSAGPIGGGGSNVYGVLQCGKIYTVFLATADKQWSLQYCQKSLTPDLSQNRGRSTVIHTELPILAPDPEARFDFKRLPLPPGKQGKSILLRGVLTEEGKPENIEVYQGLLPVMDTAAVAAFKQWTFKPAMRAGKPVRVEILISIPMN